ncbi:cysteine synthase A [Fusobacterium sp.]|uniref:cysteine synthase A n=1 Tax=Fusobacterium sp. TaxID=68766 RepID=UPI0025BF9118|nr:cysteine synthase A [Fusobacterium sp.]MCI5724693.1 cysteine synthase A [Fusobacterium sp.]MCI7223877.1 cysteine synthase A [Fusobacterium sp.]
MIYKNIIDLIGNTPVVQLKFPEKENIAEIYIKLEKFNIGGSVKDRAALGMIEAAEKNGLLKADSVIVEPTSGNTGIALALIGKLKGYKVIVVMPDTMSIERRALIKAYGAELILTDGAKGTKGAIEEAERLVSENKNYFIPQQFNNPANPQKHYDTTAEEILADFKSLDAFVAGVGTSGTLTGVGKKLKENFSNIQIIAVEPEDSPVLSGGQSGKHVIQGIGAGFIPKNYDVALVDEIIKISNDEALTFTKRIAKEEGLFLGISSGANIAAAYTIAKKLGKGKKVLTISPDGGEKYLSLPIFQD